jgi:hypothetical protein
MRAPIRVATGSPSAAKAAKSLGVSKKVASDLRLLAERSLKTGEFVLPGVGRLVRIKTSSKNGAKFRVVKTSNGAAASAKKK